MGQRGLFGPVVPLNHPQNGIKTTSLGTTFFGYVCLDKTLEDCNSFEERFLYVMKNLSTFAARPKGLDGSYFDEFFKAATFASLTAEDKQTYRKTMGTINDYLNTIDYAREEGREEGRVEEREEMARRMKEKGIHIETIAEISGLTVEQIKALQECPKMSAEPTPNSLLPLNG